MSAFFLAFLLAALVTAAGAEATRVARLSAAPGPRAALIVACVLASVATSFGAAWLGATLAGQLTPAASAMLVAFALVAAAVEMALLRPGPPPREPTHSTFAILVVLVMRQAVDGARFLILALGLATGLPWFAGGGGALGSGAIVLLAALAGVAWETYVPQRALRWAAAIPLLVSGLALGFIARLG